MTQQPLPLESPDIAKLMAKRDKAHRDGQFASEERFQRRIYKLRHAQLRAFVRRNKRGRGRA